MFEKRASFARLRRDRTPCGGVLLVRLSYVYVNSETSHADAVGSWELAACYLRANMFDQLVHEFRYFMLEYPSQTEPLRLFLALLSHGQRAIEAFNGTRILKFGIRQLKVVERAVLGPAGGNASKNGDRRGSSPIVDRKGKGKERARDQDDAQEDAADDDEEAQRMMESGNAFQPTKLSPAWMSMYGMMLHVSQSHQPAISTSANFLYGGVLSAKAWC